MLGLHTELEGSDANAPESELKHGSDNCIDCFGAAFRPLNPKP